MAVDRGVLLRICVSKILILFILMVPRADAEEKKNIPECVRSFDKKVPGLKYLASGLIDPTPDVTALDHLPRDRCGFVDWTRAFEEGMIAPKNSILIRGSLGDTEKGAGEVLIRAKGAVKSDVLFRHDTHTVWLSCSNCHPGIFEKRAGAAAVTMADVWEGRYCGRCHGKVAFPLVDCYRCHSTAKRARGQR